MRICIRRDELVAHAAFSCVGQIQSEVLDELTHESFLDIVTPIAVSVAKRRKGDQNQIQWGASWLPIQQRFSNDVVALICIAGTQSVNNSFVSFQAQLHFCIPIGQD